MGPVTSVQPDEQPQPPDFPTLLLTQPETDKRARLIAQQAVRVVNGAAVVYVLDADREIWIPRAVAGDVEVESGEVPLRNLTLGIMAERGEATVFAADDLVREHYGHLRLRRTVVALACVPLKLGMQILGAIECVAFDRPITPPLVQQLAEIAAYGAPALSVALEQERANNESLAAISRLTQLYDIEKVFSSTLEMDDLLQIIPGKIQDVLNVQAVNLWLVEKGDNIELVGRAGFDPTVTDKMLQAPGEGIATEVSESGEPLIVQGEDERLARRNAALEEGAAGAITGVAVVPILEESALVGVLEVCNKLDGADFDEDDIFFLSNLAEAAGSALHNAQLLLAERKVEILRTLVDVSKQITSTLNLERVLATIVNGPSTVIPYERAALGLYQYGRLQLKAISGETLVNQRHPNVRRLAEVLDWVALSEGEVWVRQHDDEIDARRPEEQAKFREYFAQSGSRGFYALSLADDEGRVGVLSFESSDPDFLNRAHVEMINVLAAQATVALRNAQLYQEVPFISVLEPLLEKKRKFMAMEKTRRRLMIAVAAAVVVVLAVVPIPMRVDGTASVAPLHRALVQPEDAGVIRQVYVREGQWVPQGAVLAGMDDWEPRSALAAAEARYRTAQDDMNHALAISDTAEAGVQRSQVSYWAAEVERSRERLEHTQLRAPIAGYVTTPHIEDFTGRRLEAGEQFAEIADNTHASVDVAVDENALPLLRDQQEAVVKLDGFPLQTFHGRVEVVSPRSQFQGENAVFFARLDVNNPRGLIRPGMQGRSKISIGWRPAGYVLFRGPAMWLYSKLWSWFGW
jgi:RND family efflux transporter MFP subunit